jgi:hypothetical protein
MEFSDGEMRKHAPDCKASAAVTEWRKLYDEGTLPACKVQRLEKIPGWTW